MTSTFHVPKGVSLVYALNQDERILSAFRTSVRETMDELEADMKTRVASGQRDSERTTREHRLCRVRSFHGPARRGPA